MKGFTPVTRIEQLLNEIEENTSGGGGGASNVVTGTFEGTTTGAAMDVTIPYTGDGYPVAIMIYPSRSDADTINTLVQRYAIRDYFAEKYNTNPPSYSGTGADDGLIATAKYKNVDSAYTIYAAGGTSVTSTSGMTKYFNDEDATASADGAVKIRSNKKISVFIAGTSYGFAANIEYTYYIIYSS